MIFNYFYLSADDIQNWRRELTKSYGSLSLEITGRMGIQTELDRVYVILRKSVRKRMRLLQEIRNSGGTLSLF